MLFTGQTIWHERSQGVGVISGEEAVALGATGPILRAAGVPWDLRRDMPYCFYDQVDFDVVVGKYGDTFDRYAVRINEVRESMRIRMSPGSMPASAAGLPGVTAITWSPLTEEFLPSRGACDTARVDTPIHAPRPAAGASSPRANGHAAVSASNATPMPLPGAHPSHLMK